MTRYEPAYKKNIYAKTFLFRQAFNVMTFYSKFYYYFKFKVLTFAVFQRMCSLCYSAVQVFTDDDDA